MFTFTPGRRYIVATPLGLGVGTFIRRQDGQLVFHDYTEFVELGQDQAHKLDATQIIDAEQWRQTVELVDYTHVPQAASVIKIAAKRGDVEVPRCKKLI